MGIFDFLKGNKAKQNEGAAAQTEAAVQTFGKLAASKLEESRTINLLEELKDPKTHNVSPQAAFSIIGGIQDGGSPVAKVDFNPDEVISKAEFDKIFDSLLDEKSQKISKSASHASAVSIFPESAKTLTLGDASAILEDFFPKEQVRNASLDFLEQKFFENLTY